MLPVIDLHCDTLYRLAVAPEPFVPSSLLPSPHITYPGLCSAKTLLQCFALFTDLCETPDSPPTASLKKQYSCFRQILSFSGGHFIQVRTSSELDNCIKQNKIGALLTLEESCLSETPLSLLPDLFSMGVRIASLTWDYSTLLGTSATNAPPASLSTNISALLSTPSSVSGLSSLGFDFLSEAERLGILIDVSHLSDAGFYEVAANSKKPFLASHSNARAVCRVPRNLSDPMLRILADRGGLAGLCLHEPFLAPTAGTRQDIEHALISHVKHIISVAGSDILALGTDFDGTPGNRVIPDVSHLFLLEELLKKAGLTSGEIEKLFYKNALRFLRENLPQ